MGQLPRRQDGPPWILILIETMRAEWGVSLHDALFVESVTAALALWPAMMMRHGAEPHQAGMTHIDRARQKGKEDARAWIEEHFTVVRAGVASRAPSGVETRGA